MSENRVIGRDNNLPWNLPRDMRWFFHHTRGKPVIMGRRTFESMGAALPGRRNLVLSRNVSCAAPGAELMADLEEAYKALDPASPLEPMVLGGSQVYQQALETTGDFAVQRLYRTLVHAELSGDTFFPEMCMDAWCRVFCERHESDGEHAYPFTFEIFERK